MNILAIGNSFSQDATAYLHQMAEACGANAQVANLYVPGCSLESHWKFVQNGDEPAYDLEENGAKTGRKISLRAALGLRRWGCGAGTSLPCSKAAHSAAFEAATRPICRCCAVFAARFRPAAGCICTKHGPMKSTAPTARFLPTTAIKAKCIAACAPQTGSLARRSRFR